MKKFKIAEKIAKLFRLKKGLDEEFYENLEDILIEGDFGARNAMEISDKVREMKPANIEEFNSVIRNLLQDRIKIADISPVKDELNLYLVLGVNGVGKTTSIAKLANMFSKDGNKVVLAAGDTFRAAAIDQLSTHGERLGVRVVKQENGSDSAAVIYDAISSAMAKKDDVILCDTAGRMHNKENLMKELQKIDKIVKSRVSNANYKKLLVIDATTGQNAISQGEIFNKAIGIDAVILTKFDSASKAGALVQLGIPIAYVGTGERYDDIHQFDKEEFMSSLLEK